MTRLLGVFCLFTVLSATLVAHSSTRSLINEIPGHLQDPIAFPCGKSIQSLYWLPCSSSDLGLERENYWGSQLLLGGDLGSMPDLYRLAEGSLPSDQVIDILTRRDGFSFYGDLSLDFVGTYYRISLVPYRLRFFSKMSHSALPQLLLFSLLQREVNWQTGTYLGDDWFAGFELQLVEKHVIKTDISLLEAIVNEDVERELEPRRQRGVYFNPSVLYERKDLQGRPAFFLKMEGLGLVDEKLDNWSRPVEIDVGVKGVFLSPLGSIDWSVQHRGYPLSQTYVDSWDVYMSYQNDGASLYTSYGPQRWQLGGDWRRGFWQTGLSFLQEDFGDFIGQRQTVIWKYSLVF